MADGSFHEVEFFKTHGVMGTDEIQKLNDDRKSFVERAEDGLISWEECVERIMVESDLLKICKSKICVGQRSNVQQMEIDDGGNIIIVDLLTTLSNRINYLYYYMFLLFPVQVSSLTEYMTFFFCYKQFITIKCDLLSTVLSRSHSDPEVYITAATFVYANTSDIETARQYFADGLKYHKSSKNLYMKDFWVETQHIEDSDGASMPVALKKYENILQCFKGDMEFHFELLDSAIRFSTVWELQYRVIRDMVEKYRNRELMWRKLASINLDGFIYEHESKILDFDWRYKRRLEHCFKAYENGLKDNLPPKKRYKLWIFFIDHVIEIWKAYGMVNETIQRFMNEAMEKVFQEAYDNGVLHKAEHYVYWAEYSYEERSEISNRAIEMNKNNPNIWTELLKLYANHDCYVMVKKVFEDGVKSLENNSLLLWETMNLYMKNKDHKLIVEFYINGINYPCEEINLRLKLLYLQWSKEYSGLTTTRKLFKELINKNPVCVKLYFFMISFEKSSNTLDVTSISDLYNDACTRFGQKDVKLWVEGIKFAYIYGKQLKARKMYETSLSVLVPELSAVLKNEFDIIEEEFTKRNLVVDPDVINIADEEE